MNQLNLQFSPTPKPTLRLAQGAIKAITFSMIVVSTFIFITGVLAGIYALAASLAIAMASNFNFTETNRHRNVVAFERALKLAKDTQLNAGLKCDLIETTLRLQCHAASMSEQRRANRAASENIKTSTPQKAAASNGSI